MITQQGNCVVLLYHALNIAVEETLKGKEIQLLPGQEFNDKDGTVRTDIRIKWWENPLQSTYKSKSVEPISQLSDLPVSGLNDREYYKEHEKPVFFGHYWLEGHPQLYRNNICCLDYSVAKNGYLVAYRWDGESQLSSDKLVWVKA